MTRVCPHLFPRQVKLARLGSSEGGAALLGGRLATGRWLCPSATSVPAAAGGPRTLARSRTRVLGTTVCPPRLPLQLWGTAGWGDPPTQVYGGMLAVVQGKGHPGGTEPGAAVRRSLGLSLAPLTQPG